MKKVSLFTTALVIFATIFLTACTAQKPDSSAKTQHKLKIVTTIYPFTDLAQKIVGDKATVESIIPGGMEPHDYEPTPQNIITIKNADLFIYNGLPAMESWLPKVKPFIKDVTSINVSAQLTTFDGNPHFWLDPENDEKTIDMIVSAIAQKDPANIETYRHNADAIKSTLQDIDQQYKKGLANCKIRDIIVSHDAYAYLAKKYNITSHPIAGLSTETEPDTQTIAQLVNLVREKKIPSILFETLASPKIAETIAKEAGVSTMMLNPIEGLTEEQINNNEDMPTIMKSNLSTLEKVMQCTP